VQGGEQRDVTNPAISMDQSGIKTFLKLHATIWDGLSRTNGGFQNFFRNISNIQKNREEFQKLKAIAQHDLQAVLFGHRPE